MRRRAWDPDAGWNAPDAYRRYPPALPKQPPPADGIKVKHAGATWWGHRWIEALERLSPEYARRIARGRTYARAGRVHDLKVRGGRVSALVTGSRTTPYTVTIRVRALSAPAWKTALAHMAGEARFAAQLLTGEMPEDIDAAFEAAGGTLFPVAQADLETACSCPDWANPCKHVAAAHYVLGEALDRDPFLLFALRGRSGDRVLDALRGMRARGAPSEARARAEVEVPAVLLEPPDDERFERPRGSLDALRFQIGEPARQATVLRQLGDPPSWSLQVSLLELLAPAYKAAGDWARALATAEAPEQEE